MAVNLPKLTQSELDLFKDKLWRLTHLYKIKDKNNCLVNLELNRVQRMMYEDMRNVEPKRYIVIKYRQGGVSTFWLLYWLDETIFTPNTTTAILAHKWESLNHLWGIIELAYKHMPEVIKPILGKESAKELYFSQIESKIFISLSIRSTALNNLHISEVCFCDDNEVRATLGAISPSSNVTMESTGNGIANDGYLTYQDAKTGENEYKYRFIPWFLQDEYKLPLHDMDSKTILDSLNQEEKNLQNIMQNEYGMQLEAPQVLFRRQVKNRLKTSFPQEYPEQEQDAFMTSGQHFFNTKKLFTLLREIRTFRRTHKFYAQSEEYTAFEEPNKKDYFVAGADTSEGMNDYSVLKIINVTKRREAFVWRAKCGVRRFYQACAVWCTQYNNALLAVEINNTGHAVIEGLLSVQKYKNLYHETHETHIIGRLSDKRELKYGWRTTAASRTKMLVDLKYAIEGNEEEDENSFHPEFMICDEGVLLEGLTFVNNDGKYESESSKNDDIIIATAIACQLYLNNRNYAHSLRGTNFGIHINRQSEAETEFSS